MSTLTIEIRSDEGRIQSITQGVPTKKSFFQSFLLLDAITNLVEGADTGGWEKHPEELQPDEFYNGVLTAIAIHFVLDGIPHPPNFSAYDALKMLIEDLHVEGYLGKQLTDAHGEAYSEDD